jgi:hypothetical protein
VPGLSDLDRLPIRSPRFDVRGVAARFWPDAVGLTEGGGLSDADTVRLLVRHHTDRGGPRDSIARPH